MTGVTFKAVAGSFLSLENHRSMGHVLFLFNHPVDKIQSLAFFVLFGIVFILNLSSLIMFSSHDYRMAGIVSIIAFIVHSTCYGFTVNAFLAIGSDFYDSAVKYGWTMYFGPGLYVSAGAGLLSLIGGLISLGIYYKGRSSDYKGLSGML